MGTVIRSIAINNASAESGVATLIAETADRCLQNAGVDIGAVGMLINTGVYTENHLLEPASATLIHRRLLDKNKQAKRKSGSLGNLLSFDLHNGGGGIVNALQVVDGFISSGEIEYGLIVSGDVKPKIGKVENYKYSSSAAAVLVSKEKSKPGFIKFKTETFPEFKENITSTTRWKDGGLHLVNKKSNDYLKNAVDCAAKTIQNFFDEELLGWKDVDLICTSQNPLGFVTELQKKLKIKNKIVCFQGDIEIYSSGLLYSMNHIIEKEEFKNCVYVLFLTVGAGITVSLAYYNNKL
ncbi:hypothetical protein OU798_00420 [Prolixibacteraceae bacterium Z1-6]|uniref:Beta-ketoacyl-[acyl-carrier-protein] synthase III N-terminal domain-containing protein n=1 Tax=Draconibacterium aestuarii TaxID=2998507 RepID=A0A9X3J5N5_9BACT|nr:hypothetical protein [Prolixibacteraceae bacterium Z1-6]